MTAFERKIRLTTCNVSGMSNTWFRLMAAESKIRDFFRPREAIVKEADLKLGYDVLDFGCGPGGYVQAVSKAIGALGELYALDVTPLALDMVEKKAKEKGFANVQTILSDCATGLPSGEIDVALLYDVFHDLTNQSAVLQEIHRVLKPSGRLSFSDHHMKEREIIAKVTAKGLFKLEKKTKHTYTFRK